MYAPPAGADGRMTPFSYEWTAKMLLRLGFTDVNQIDRAIEGYDDDKLSRVAFGTRQGQLMRFELQLLAAIGEPFILRHPYSEYGWFAQHSRERLECFKQAGITTRNNPLPTAHPAADPTGGASDT
jgi:hypothetical protein